MDENITFLKPSNISAEGAAALGVGILVSFTNHVKWTLLREI
jgi:hypothetical protein